MVLDRKRAVCFTWLVCVTVVEFGVYGLKNNGIFAVMSITEKKVSSYELGYIFLLSILMDPELMNIFYL